MSARSQARVTAQYGRFPYPSRDPADERKRVIGTPLDNIDLINHHCFRGDRNFDGFRVLVAGGGSGDATIFLAHQPCGRGAEIVHLDVSAAAIDVARARAAVHGFDDIRFVQASLLDAPALGLGRFDYINRVGVLYHLDDPRAGLDALVDVLAEDGAMAILVYARYGRTGVYDLLLHPKDRTYTVGELYEWFEDARGLAIEFSDLHRGRLPYEPETYLVRASAELAARLRALPPRTRHAIAELARGDLVRHSFHATRGRDTKAPYGDVAYVPLFPAETYQPSGEDFVRIIAQHGGRPFRLTHTQSGLAREIDPGRYVPTIFAHLDGRRAFGEIFERVRADPSHRGSPPSDAELFAEFAPWYDALESIDRLVLRRAPRGNR